jgi:hypothetical protein
MKTKMIIMSILMLGLNAYSFAYSGELVKEEEIKKTEICGTVAPPPSCLQTALNQVELMNTMANENLWSCINSGLSGCGAAYNQWTADALAWIESEAESCMGFGNT